MFCSLQRVENNLQDILCSIETLMKYLLRIKTDEHFIIFYQGIQAEAKSLTDEPSLARPRKPPSRFAAYLPAPTCYRTIYDFYHHQYFDFIDKIISSLDSRFNPFTTMGSTGGPHYILVRNLIEKRFLFFYS